MTNKSLINYLLKGDESEEAKILKSTLDVNILNPLKRIIIKELKNREISNEQEIAGDICYKFLEEITKK